MTKVNPVCGDCGVEKERADFYADRKKVNGLSTYCKGCTKKRSKARYALDPEGAKRHHKAWVAKNRDRVKFHKAKHAYGITEEEFKNLGDVCVICGAEGLCTDHSHQTGRVRGRLCNGCNKGLGFFRDDPTRLLRAADYVLGVLVPATAVNTEIKTEV